MGLAVILSLGALAALPATSLANTYAPTRTDDPAPGACAPSDCSLRGDLGSQRQRGADVIRLQSGQVYGLQHAGQAMRTPTRTGDLDINREPHRLSDELTITTTGGGLATINANGAAIR